MPNKFAVLVPLILHSYTSQPLDDHSSGVEHRNEMIEWERVHDQFGMSLGERRSRLARALATIGSTLSDTLIVQVRNALKQVASHDMTSPCK